MIDDQVDFKHFVEDMESDIHYAIFCKVIRNNDNNMSYLKIDKILRDYISDYTTYEWHMSLICSSYILGVDVL